MQRLLAIIVLACFVCAGVVLPALHRAHCDAAAAADRAHAAPCALCHLATQPLEVAVPAPALVAASARVVLPPRADRPLPPAPPGGIAQARGPPAA